METEGLIHDPVLYEDRTIIVVNKKPGRLVHPVNRANSTEAAGPWPSAPSVNEETFLDFLIPRLSAPVESFSEPDRPGIVHRIDRETSGLLLAAKTPEAEAILKEAFRERRVEKYYMALVKGVLYQVEGVIDTPLVRNPRQRVKRMISKRDPAEEGSGNPKDALTEFFVEERFEKYSLLRVKIHTGRTHQIRVHLHSIGHPVAGDRLYDRNWLQTGSRLNPRRQAQTGMSSSPRDAKDGEERAEDPHLFLAAVSLAFAHPDTGEWVTFTAPLPDFFEKRLGELRAKRGKM